MRLRAFTAIACTTLLFLNVLHADEPEGAFARGEKLPGDLSDLLDADADGAITDNEAQMAAKEFAKKATTDDDLLKALDKDKDGKVAPKEAEDAVANIRAEQDESGKYVADIFRKLDANGDNFVTGVEFQNSDAFGPLGALLKPQLGRMLVQYDANRDSMISFTEAQMVAGAFAAQSGMKKKQAAAETEAKFLNQARPVFAALDANRNNKISFREAKRDAAFNSVFNDIDTDGDKNASVEEVVAYLKAKAQ